MAKAKHIVFKKTARVVKLEIYVETNINGKDCVKAELTYTCGKDTAIELIKSYLDHNDRKNGGRA